MRRLSPWMRLSAAPLFLCGFVLMLNPVDSAAQIAPQVAAKKDGKKKREDYTDGLFLFIDRDASRSVDAIKDYLKKEKVPWNDICELIQTLLEKPGDKLIETKREHPTEGTIRIKVSLKEELNRILGSFNKEGREYYQLTYGPRADARLRDALNPDSPDSNEPMRKMADIASTYLHTKAGAEAIVRLGTWHLDRGRYMMAALTLRKFEQRNPDDVLPPGLLLKLAIAFKRLGENKQAEEYWAKLAKATGGEEIVLGSRKFKLEQLRAEFDRIVTRNPNEAIEYVVIGGDSTHNAQGVGGRPFLDPKLQISMTQFYPDYGSSEFDTKPFEWIQQNLQQAIDRINRQPNQAIIPAFFPITLPGKVIFRTYDGVYCFLTKDASDSAKAGTIEWRTQADSSLHSILKDTTDKSRIMFENTWYKPFYATQGPFGIFFENGLVGCLSHDDKYVYYIDDLYVPPHPMQMYNFSMNGQQPNFNTLNDKVERNRLVAIDSETGKLKWTLGGGGVEEPKKKEPIPDDDKKLETANTLFSKCFFLGAPLPISGKIYAVIEKDKEMILACINPDRHDASNNQYPELEWYQPLGSPQTPLPQDSFRRIQGVHLGYSDGVLVCPTNAGAIVGIDLQTRNIIWSHSYRKAAPKANSDQEEQMMGRGGRIFRGGMAMMGDTGGVPQTISPDRWRVSYPIISQGKIVMTAYDGDAIHCLDLHSGNLSWESARNTDDLYVAGVFENRVMVVGKASVRFLSLADGSQIGQSISIGIPSGVGTASNGFYLLPIKESPETKEPEIWTIDVAKGVVTAKTKSRKKNPVGNLIFHEGDVISQSPTELAAFPQLQVKKDEMIKRLHTDPNDPFGLTAMGELQLDDGDLLLAINTFKKVLGYDIKEDLRIRARNKLHEAMTEYIQECARVDFSRADSLLAEYKELCSIPVPAGADALLKQSLLDEELRRKSNYYALVGKGREAQGRLLEAFESYQTFGSLVDNKEMVTVADQPTTSARPDVWARGRIEAMLRNSKPENRKPLQSKIEESWLKIKDANDLEQLRSFVKLFGNPEHEAGNESRLVLAKKLALTMNEEDSREAEMLLLSLRGVKDAGVAARATEQLAGLYMKRNLFESSIRMYRRLGTQFASVKLPDGRTGEQSFSELVTDKRFLPYLEPTQHTWDAKLHVTEIPGGGGNMQTMEFPIQPEDDEVSPFFDRYRVGVDTNFGNNQQWKLKITDRMTGETKFTSKPLVNQNFGGLYLNQFQTFNYNRLYQIKGHILVLQVLNMVYAFDLAAKKQLWAGYDLFGKNPPLNVNNNNGGQRIEFDPDGDLRMLYSDGTAQRIGRIGLLQPNYLCLLTRDGLTALDPLTGSVLWTKRNVPANTRLFGDQDYIFYYELNQSGSASAPKAVRASDGVEFPLPDNALLLGKSHKLRDFGRLVLAKDFDSGNRTLRLVDILTGKDVWKREGEKNSILAASDDFKHVGFVSLKGDVQVFDSATGESIFKAKLDQKLFADHLAKVESVLILSDSDQFYIGLHSSHNANGSMGITNNVRSIPLNGVLYAFDRKTGALNWYTSDEFESQNIIVDRFAELPVVIGTSTVYVNNSNTFRTVILDKKTGKLLYGQSPMYGNYGWFFALNVDSKAKTIELLRNDLRLKLAPEAENKTPVSVSDQKMPATPRKKN